MEIVGLKNFVQDDVNKLIVKFVGVKPHPLAKLLKPLIEEYYECHPGAEVCFATVILFYRKRCYRCNSRFEEEEE
jgi:hypothetical protein